MPLVRFRNKAGTAQGPVHEVNPNIVRTPLRKPPMGNTSVPNQPDLPKERALADLRARSSENDRLDGIKRGQAFARRTAGNQERAQIARNRQPNVHVAGNPGYDEARS